jgi:crossover junction endodeoxyribonuclease RuvC
MIVLGIDPGSRKAGFGLVKIEKKRIEYIDSGVMRYDKIDQFMDRLGVIYQSCRELAVKYQPHEVALESLIYTKSVTSLAKLAQARGAMIAAFMETHRQKVYEYSPNLIKSTVSGHGHASKESMVKALNMIFKSNIDFATHDESDALAIAICHALNLNSPFARQGKTQKRSGGSSLKQAFKHLE